jgi:hypothetical protein
MAKSFKYNKMVNAAKGWMAFDTKTKKDHEFK